MPETSDAITSLIDRVEGLSEKLDAALRDLEALRRKDRPAIPEDTLYNQQEVGIRLKGGENPIGWSKERKEAAPKFSAKKIKNLDDAGVLRSIKIGGEKKWTEAEVQHYLRGCQEGWIDGYVFDPLKMK